MALNIFKTLREKNLAETTTEVASNVAESVVSEIGEDWKAFLKMTTSVEEKAAKTIHKIEGELKEGEAVSLNSKQEKPASRAEAAIDYHREIVHSEAIKMNREGQVLSQQLEEIRVELVKIRQASKEMEATFKDVTTETMTRTVKPGKYHVNFFEWMLSTLQSARVRIESGNSWLSALSGKRAAKDYWSLSKTHGTSFSMSGERAVAQQVG